MALPLNEKLRRILSFLVGVRNPRVFSIMATRGFSHEDLEEGWELFTTAAGEKLTYSRRGTDPMAPNEARRYLAELDHWENTWYPVISATLERHYPEIHEQVFKNLAQTDGVEVMVSVGTLIQRITEMQSSTAGQEANALLNTRGLTNEIRDQATTIIDTLKKHEEAQLPQLDPAAVEKQRMAMVDAWTWYREWSQIARTVIKRGDVLVRLGLRQLERGRRIEEVEELEGTESIETTQDTTF